MFSRKEKQVIEIPILTVHTVPQKYEIIGQVHCIYTKIIGDTVADINKNISKKAIDIGADAVIGLIVVSQESISGMAIGTAIKYID